MKGWVSLLIGISCFFLVLFLIFTLGHSYRSKKHHEHSIYKPFQGIYLNEEGRRSEFSIQKDGRFRHHRQGTSSIVDAMWLHHKDTDLYYSTENEIAKLKEDTVLLYKHGQDTPSEILTRIHPACLLPHSAPPTLANITDLYELVSMATVEQEALSEWLSKNRWCATANDWNLATNSIMSTGIFALDRANTCCYYVSPEQFEILHFKTKIQPRIGYVSDFKDRIFLGAMI